MIDVKLKTKTQPSSRFINSQAKKKEELKGKELIPDRDSKLNWKWIKIPQNDQRQELLQKSTKLGKEMEINELGRWKKQRKRKNPNKERGI